MATKILVLTNAWTLVGNIKIHSSHYSFTDASVIRHWGTSKGLGEIAAGGPTPNTTLDKIGTGRVEKHAVLFVIDCEESKWTGA